MRDRVGVRFSRRVLVGHLAALGVAGVVAGRVWTEASVAGPVPSEALSETARLARLDLPESERALMLKGAEELGEKYEQLRSAPLPNQVTLAQHSRRRCPPSTPPSR